MRIKRGNKIIILGFLGGASFWLLDALLDKFIKFPHVPFINIFLYDAPTHEFLIRPIMLVIFTAFGVLLSRYVKRLEYSEGQYHYLFDCINDIVLVRPFSRESENEKFLLANPVASKILGYTREELLQLTPSDLVAPEMFPEFNRFSNDLEVAEPAVFETMLLTKEGKAIPVEVNAHVIEFHGKPCVLCIIRNIAGRKKSEEQIRRLASFPQLTPNPVLEVNSTGDIIFCNISCLETVEKLGEKPEAFLPGDLEEILQAAINQEEREFHRELEIKGALFSESIYYVPQFQVARIFPIDITERRKAEDCLRDSEQQLRILATRILEVQENERSRITKELHDELGQSLLLLKLQVSTIMNHLRKDQEKLRQECAHILTHISTLIEDIRRLLRDLSPAVLEELGLTSALRLLLEDLNKHYNIDTSSMELDNIDQLFPAKAQLSIYRIFQETLTNIGKHAKATQVSSLIKKSSHQVRFLIKDNGRGFEPADLLNRDKGSMGIGLSTIKERIRFVGGQLDINSREGGGTEIAFTLPVRTEKENGDALPNRLSG